MITDIFVNFKAEKVPKFGNFRPNKVKFLVQKFLFHLFTAGMIVTSSTNHNYKEMQVTYRHQECECLLVGLYYTNKAVETKTWFQRL